MSSDHERTALAVRDAPIAMSADEFRRVGHRLVDTIAEFIDSIPRRPVNRDELPSELQRLLPHGPLPESGTDAARLFEDLAPLLFEHSLLNGHPRFLGYITSAPAPIGALADLLGASINPNLGGWQLSPIASEIEKQALRWVAEMIGYPADCGGLFVSGGNMANFTCYLAARRSQATWDVRKQGVGAGRGRMLVYATDETHTWIDKAADLFGQGTDVIRKIPVDRELRADLTSLRRTIEDDLGRGDLPFLVVASGGTVSTGAIDPIAEMTAIAREYGLWLHVDGAYGALAAALPDAPLDLQALADADSVAVDPHKWLYTPLEAGCALVRDPQKLRDAFAYAPRYYHFSDGAETETNFYELGLQNSRGFRALKVWLALRQVGRRGYVQMIGDDVRLAQALHENVQRHDELEARSLGLSIVTFRFVPASLERSAADAEAYLSRLNEALLERLKRSGELFLSNALIGDTFLLRACVVNFRTSLGDIDAIPEIVVRHGRELDAAIRPAGASV